MGAVDRIFRGRRSGSQQRPLAALAAALFAAGEQGLWYDIEGLRDAWNAVGPELVTNSGFDAGLSGWTTIGGSTQSVSSGLLTISGGGAAGGVYQDIATTAAYLLITVQVRRVSGTGNGAVWGVPRTGGFAAPNSQLTVSTTVASALGSMSFLLQREPTASGVRVYVQAVGGDGVFEVDSISVREWLGTTALYQDAAGTLPAYMPGQGQIDPPVGLMLDKRKGLSRGAEQFNDATVVITGESSRVSPGVYRIYSSAGAYSGITIPTGAGLWYEISFTVDSVAVAGAGLTLESAVNPTFNGAGRKTFIAMTTIGGMVIKRAGGAVDYQISAISLRRIDGAHAYQATTASRPTLSARYNLLASTDSISDSSWNLGTAWSATVGDTAPDGSPTAVKIKSLTGGAATSRVVAATAPQLKFVIYTKSGTYVPTVLVRNNTSATSLMTCTQIAGVVNNAYGQGVVSDVGGGWRKIVVTITSGVTVGDLIGLYYGATGSVAAGLYWWIWHPDLRAANDGVGVPDYQRVVDANTYDTAGFPLYLRFDGVDDSLQTTSVDFSGTDKMAVCASVRKLSDATTGMLVELSSTIANNAGAMCITAPGAANTANIKLATKGTIEVNVATGSSAFPSPVSAVVSGFMDISASVSTLRVNGSIAQTSSLSLGTGALGNYPLYIGRRGGSSLPFNGRLYGLLIRGGAINDVQISKVERYLNQKAKVY